MTGGFVDDGKRLYAVLDRELCCFGRAILFLTSDSTANAGGAEYSKHIR